MKVDSMCSAQVTFLPNNVTMEFGNATDILQLAQRHSIPIDQSCNGNSTCGKCKIIAEGPCNKPTPQELKLLSDDQIDAGWRLACFCIPEGDVVVHVPVRSKISVLSNGVDIDVDVDTTLTKKCVSVNQPSLQDQRGDYERLIEALGGTPSLTASNTSLLRQLPGILRNNDYMATVTTRNNEIIDIEPGDTASHLYGAAFDIGTTTIVGYLFDINSGNQCAVASTINPQTQYGGDVISRIEYASTPETAETLRRCIIGGLNSLLEKLIKSAKIDLRHVYDVEIAGNTTMLHLALGFPTESIARAPYIPVNTSRLFFEAKEVGLNINPCARVNFMPHIASYVGGDITAGILASSLDDLTSTTLFIDIGTNGEMVLQHDGNMLAAATAAGPCFEGGSISQGMRAEDGAISSIQFVDGNVVIETINGCAAKGLCGTGLVDLVSEMLRTQLIDDSGRLQSAEDSDCEDEALLQRIRQGQNGNEFVIVEAEKSGIDGDVVITQRDIRQVQNAKAAVYAGIMMLCKKANIEVEQIDSILLAGAFGNYIRTLSAMGIGLIPRMCVDKVNSVGNAAGMGASMALLSTMHRRHTCDIRSKVRYIELSGDPEFSDIYADAMFFE